MNEEILDDICAEDHDLARVAFLLKDKTNSKRVTASPGTDDIKPAVHLQKPMHYHLNTAREAAEEVEEELDYVENILLTHAGSLLNVGPDSITSWSELRFVVMTNE